MIKAIIFDFGNVICHFTNDILRQRIADISGKTVEEIKELVYIKSDIGKRFEAGLINGQEFYEELCQICGINIPYQELKTIYSKDKFTRVEGTKELIEKLRKKYKVSLLSNTSEWDWDYMIQVAPEVLSFDSITKSYEVKAMKPSEVIYADALKKLNLKPEECVYTDDILEYVDKAKSLGFEAFQFTTANKFEEDLKSIGIEIL
ncbi:D-ribitol-5-phosphate phosphatase [bioreactor metagenome]|uniref:D-ribitol-5-phosphate phosphatase n=1 Tax=bioreactor metagenome TaxID=1076179 RepID=A0A645B1E1_9ZZZZ